VIFPPQTIAETALDLPRFAGRFRA
jgi:hypothetical protein